MTNLEGLEAIVSNAADGILVIDKGGIVRFANPAAISMFAGKTDGLVGSEFGLPVSSEFIEISIQKNGGFFPVEMRTVPFTWEHEPATLATLRNMTEHREAEQRIRFQSDLLDSAGEAIIATNLVGEIVYWNRAAKDLYGWSAEEVLGKNVVEVIPSPAQQDQAQEFMDILLQDGRWKGESQMQRKDGSCFHAALTNTPIVEPEGKTIGIIGVSSDITERLLWEEELRRQRDLADGIINTAPVIILILDTEGRIVRFNPYMENISGYSLEESLGKDWFSVFIPHNERDETRKLFETALHRSPTIGYTNPIVTKSGKEVIVEWYDSIVKDESGETIGLMAVGQDITSRRRAEEESNKLADVVRNMNDGLHLYELEDPDDDTSLRMIATNPAAERITGIPGEAIVGKTIGEAFPVVVEKGIHTSYAEVVRTGRSQMIENLSYSDELVSSEFSIVAFPLPNHCVGVLFEDVTEKNRMEGENRKLEEQLIQSQKMESIGRLAGGVAHDFNNQLTVMRGYAELIHNALNDGDPLREHADQIRTAAESSAKLTSQLLAFSRKQIANPQIINLNDCIRRSENMLSRMIGEDIQLEIALEDGLSAVYIDIGQVDQILLNLAINARDAMENGGLLTIDTHNVVLESEHAIVQNENIDGAFVVLSVGDSGTGIPEETIEHIFEPFFTTKETGKGTGLGLSMIYGIVKQNHGYVSVYSELDKGTIFKIYLPQVEGEAEDLRKQNEMGILSGDERLLLVEDNDEVREVARLILSDNGYDVVCARSGSEALLICEANDADFDLILTDVVMPKMDGRELHQELKGMRRGLKVLFMSGYAETRIAHHGILEEGTSFIQKPFRPRELLLKVRQVLDDRRIGKAEEDLPEPVRGMVVLVVDDNKGVRLIVTEYLERAGMEVRTAENAADCMTRLEEIADQVRLVLLDITLPDSGWEESLGSIRKTQRNIPVVLMSGLNPDGLESALEGDRFLRFLRKPFTEEGLIKEIHELIGVDE